MQIKKDNITSIAIGGFDGMHLAHQALFNCLDDNGAIVVIESGYSNLSPNKYRENYTNYPIFYYMLNNIKHLNAVQFIDLLNKEFHSLNTIIVGYDFRFGKNRMYTIEDLKRIFKLKVIVVKEILLNNISIHSRTIREYINSGDFRKANLLLGKEYQISGYKIDGQGLGKKYFIPTINLYCDDFLLPKQAVYITKTILNNKEYNSITFIGNRVTTDNKFSIETHILKDIIIDSSLKEKQSIKIKFYSKLRDNKKFKSYDELKYQILEDIKKALILLKNVRIFDKI